MNKKQILKNVETYLKSQNEISPEIILENKIDFKLEKRKVKSKIEKQINEEIKTINKSKLTNQVFEDVKINIVRLNKDWEKAHSLAELDNSINKCLSCTLGSTRKSFVFGTGNPNADIMIIGEAPGADEDEQGKPFVGRAGQLLTQIIEAINLKREDLFIANIIKCRPPANRRPMAEEVEQCEPFLQKQIELINPKFILALGLTAVDTLLKGKHKMADTRGKLLSYYNRTMLVTYHPAALLRNPAWKKETWQDVKLLKKLYDDYLLTK